MHGGATCPWRIKAPPGQKVNLTLYDFSVWQYGENAGGTIGDAVCRRYAIISEEHGLREMPVCGGETRLRNIYLSDGNVVDIQLMHSTDQEEYIHFLIKYESKSLGRNGHKTLFHEKSKKIVGTSP